MAASLITSKTSCVAKLVTHGHGTNDSNNDRNIFVFWLYIFNFVISLFYLFIPEKNANQSRCNISLLKDEMT